jgi:hypothetical protein
MLLGTLYEAIVRRSSGILQPVSLRDVLYKGLSTKAQGGKETNGWNEYAMKQEQYRDQLRGAEQHRLVKLVADDCQEAPSGQAIKNLVSGMTGLPCDEVNRLLERAA